MIKWGDKIGGAYHTTYEGERATLTPPSDQQRWWTVTVLDKAHPIRDPQVREAKAKRRAAIIVRTQVDGPDMMGRSVWASPQGRTPP